MKITVQEAHDLALHYANQASILSKRVAELETLLYAPQAQDIDFAEVEFEKLKTEERKAQEQAYINKIKEVLEDKDLLFEDKIDKAYEMIYRTGALLSSPPMGEPSEIGIDEDGHWVYTYHY